MPARRPRPASIAISRQAQARLTFALHLVVLHLT